MSFSLSLSLSVTWSTRYPANDAVPWINSGSPAGCACQFGPLTLCLNQVNIRSVAASVPACKLLDACFVWLGKNMYAHKKYMEANSCIFVLKRTKKDGQVRCSVCRAHVFSCQETASETREKSLGFREGSVACIETAEQTSKKNE